MQASILLPSVVCEAPLHAPGQTKQSVPGSGLETGRLLISALGCHFRENCVGFRQASRKPGLQNPLGFDLGGLGPPCNEHEDRDATCSARTLLRDERVRIGLAASDGGDGEERAEVQAAMSVSEQFNLRTRKLGQTKNNTDSPQNKWCGWSGLATTPPGSQTNSPDYVGSCVAGIDHPGGVEG